LRFFYLASNQIVKDLRTHHHSSTAKPWIPEGHKRSCESLLGTGLETRLLEPRKTLKNRFALQS
jgi:hypothetical protein